MQNDQTEQKQGFRLVFGYPTAYTKVTGAQRNTVLKNYFPQLHRQKASQYGSITNLFSLFLQKIEFSKLLAPKIYIFWM